MTEISNTAIAPESIKQAIAQFLTDRLQPKLEKVAEEDSEQRALLHAAYAPKTWIADAARRVGQIQQVTHAIKYTHPDARGSSLYSTGNPQASDSEVGTHTLGAALAADVVGNAAALDVYKFLNLRVGEHSILALAVGNHPALAAALSDNTEEAQAWMSAFATLAQAKGETASHKLARQVYWPLGDGKYHLLAPLFPTSLVHCVWQSMRDDSELARAVYLARKDGKQINIRYRERPNWLAIQSFGGTKPQNISQLNSERYGENYLLPALPPNWQSAAINAPFAVDSIFDRIFSQRESVSELTDSLRDFLEFQERKKLALLLAKSSLESQESMSRESIAERLSKIPQDLQASVEQLVNNRNIREKRAELSRLICGEALLYAAELREVVETKQLPIGWTQDAACKLNRAEQLWLDPLRCQIDPDFAEEYQRKEWPKEICRRFGNWLNPRLSTKSTRMSAVEAEHWQSVLQEEMSILRMELADHE